MKNIPMKKISVFFSALTLAFAVVSPAWADAAADVTALQNEWDRVNFTLKKEEQVKPLEALITQAKAVNAAHPGNAPALIWEGIIHATYAGAKGGLGALGECKTAKSLFEQSIAIDPKALDGAAYTSAGSLYYQVPGWPVGFGDDKTAEEMLKKGLAIGPQDLDAHYFYADFLITQKRWKEAVDMLQKGLAIPDNGQRPLFQQGRRSKMAVMLKTAQGKL
jgi:tetratricopeptide (TPR) repeat protein